MSKIGRLKADLGGSVEIRLSPDGEYVALEMDDEEVWLTSEELERAAIIGRAFFAAAKAIREAEAGE